MNGHSVILWARVVSSCRYAGRSGLLCALMVLLVIQAISVGGCAQDKYRAFDGRRVSGSKRVSKQELREALDAFEGSFEDSIKYVADKLDELDPRPRTRQFNLLFRVRMLHALHTMLQQEDSVVAFIETWGLLVRMTQYFEEGEARAMYGDHQKIAINTAKDLEAKIEAIGRSFLTEEVLAETRKQLRTFALSNPIKGAFSNVVVYATEVREGQPNLFASVIGIPMSPFKAMKGVERTADAIHRFTDTAGSFSEIVEDLPESVRWQALLLLYDLQETEMAKLFEASVSQLSENSARLAETAETLPEEIREQLSKFIEEIDTKQSNLQVTLEKAEEVAVALERTVAQVDRTAKSIEKAAAAWESTVIATTELVEGFKGEPSEKEPKEAISLDDLRITAEELTTAASEFRALTAEIRQLVESPDLAERIAEANATVDRSAVQTRSVTDHLAWRIFQVIISVFVLALAYRFVVVRVIGKRSRKSSTNV